MKKDFVHLHVHSQYSMLDGLIKFPQLIEKVQKNNQTAIALTDHGNMHGTIHFYNACKKADIKPIVGCEIYMTKGHLSDKQVKMGGDQFHLTLIAMNHKGYQNLMKLVSIANLEGFSYKPRIDQETLFKYSDNLIVLSGCMNSIFNRLLRDGKEDEALEKFKEYKEVFGDRFYIELQNHPTVPELKDLNKKLVKIARQLNLELVATNDVHYLEKEDSEAQDALLCVQTRKLISDEKRMKMADNPDFYLKTTEEMIELFADYPEAIENTVKIAERCNIEIPTGQLIFPKFPLPEGETSESYFRKLAYEGLEKKFGKITPELKERADYEIDIINGKGYPTYFLITQDFVVWAKNQGIGVGPGRGSVAGSLVAFAMDITTINPLIHGLPFERFLNPERPTPPDIDMDFADDRRDEVINYCANKYGADHVGQVITFGKMEARVAIRDIGRVMGFPYEDPDKIAKLIPNDPAKKTTLEQAINTVPELGEYYKQPKFKKLIDLAKKVEGTIRHSSVHAAAVIIADKPLPAYTAIQRDSKTGKTVTQYDMYALDCNVDDNAIGLLKFDFLGLRNLSTIQTAINLIKKYKKIDLDIANIPLDDKKTYELLSRGETSGVFQLESAGMRRVARSLQPEQFSDITAMLALYRPGPMELIPQFIEGKHNPEKIEYLHPNLKSVFEETYGVMVYQEQVMQIFSLMAGYSLGEADMIRRAMGKKKIKILNENKIRFIAEAKKNGYAEEISEKVWSYIMAFANYGFNKAHAASYAMISYQTAYLKANYPVEYMTALMSVESNSHSANRDEKVAIAIEDSKKMGIKVFPPHINKSGTDFTIEQHKSSLEGLAVRFSLPAIKHVGVAAIENIIETRSQIADGKFTSLTEFIHKTDSRKVNKTVLECLIKVGAMDEFGTRASMLENLETIRQNASQFQSDIDGQDNLFAEISQVTTQIQDTFPSLPEYPQQELLSFEKELLGLYLTDNPMAETLKAVSNRANKKIEELDQVIHQGQVFLFGGVITRLRTVFTKKNNSQMAFGTLDDGTGTIEMVIFPRTFAEYGDKLVEGVAVLVKAKVEYDEEEFKLLVEKVATPKQTEIEYEKNKNYKEIFIPRKTGKDTLQKLGKLLKSHPGNQKVVVLIPNGSEPEKMVLPYGVEWNEELEKAIEVVLGE